MKKPVIFYFLPIIFFILSQKLNGMFSSSEEFSPRIDYDPENISSIENEEFKIIQKFKKQENIYEDIQIKLNNLYDQKQDAITNLNMEMVKKIESKIIYYKKLIRQDLKKSFILFIKSSCPIF